MVMTTRTLIFEPQDTQRRSKKLPDYFPTSVGARERMTESMAQ
jgi:hypothetical protein